MSIATVSKNKKQKTHRLALAGVFCAIAYVSIFIFRFDVMFLTFDIKDAVITISGLLLGPLAAALISLVVAALEMVTVSSTGLYGFIMNFISSCALSVSAALIYKYKKNFAGAIIGLLSGVTLTVALMMVFNLLVTPFYMGVPRGEVAKMIPSLLLPFNIAKGLLSASLVIVFYKPISRAVKASGAFADNSVSAVTATNSKKKSTLVALIIGISLLALALVLFFVILGGKISLFSAVEDMANKFKK